MQHVGRRGLGEVNPMYSRILALVASALAVAAILSAQAVAHPRKRVRMPADYSAWTRVAVCESGGWQVLGPAYPDSLGITASNFRAFGGRPQPPGRVSRAGIVAQIRVADRLIRHYGISIPDQSGCAGSW